jgi:nitrogenase molybdenum-iron protein alpha/beta subunit
MTQRDGFGLPMNFPCLIGVYLAVNAIPDAYLLADGPDCIYYKAHFIHGRHDWRSSLLQISGRHRVAFTNICAKGVVKDHDDLIARQLLDLDQLPESGLLLATALPMCFVTGVDYGRIIRGLRGRLRKPALDIPPTSLTGDWLDGYSQTLCALAQGLDLKKRRKKPRTAAIVGYLMDRNEADHLANIAELRRMLRALSLEPASIWLGGGKVSELARIDECEWIVSLPYGRKAARIAAGRTGGKLIEAELPFGLNKSSRFLRQVAGPVGRSGDSEAFIERELREVAPRLEWILPHLFLHRKTVFIGDPHLMDGFIDIADDAGMEFCGGIVTARAAHGGRRDGVPILHEPFESSRPVSDLLSGKDLVVACRACSSHLGNYQAIYKTGGWMEFGFPSYGHHVLYEKPFLGHKGVLAFIERMAGYLAG